jgi:hypothetical protein
MKKVPACCAKLTKGLSSHLSVEMVRSEMSKFNMRSSDVIKTKGQYVSCENYIFSVTEKLKSREKEG